MKWMLMPLRRYVDFEGRSRRKEYWMFNLFTTLLVISLFILFAILGAMASSSVGYSPLAGLLGFVMLAVLLGLFIPSLAVQVRRFHDQDKTGWFILLGLIPLVGGFVLLAFNCLDGSHGPNRFGPDPKFDLGDTFS